MVQLLSQPGSGPNGSAVTVSNCANPNQWDANPTKTGTGTTLNFDNAHLLHELPTVHKFHYATVSSTAYAQWKASVTATANSLNRIYFYFTAFPSVQLRLLSLLTGSNVNAASMVMTTGGKLRIQNSAGTNSGTTVGSIPLNAWWRVELDVLGISSGLGNIGLRYYSGVNLESTTPDETQVNAVGANVIGNINDVRLGSNVATTQTVALDYWAADMRWSDTVLDPPDKYGWGIPLVAA